MTSICGASSSRTGRTGREVDCTATPGRVFGSPWNQHRNRCKERNARRRQRRTRRVSGCGKSSGPRQVRAVIVQGDVWWAESAELRGSERGFRRPMAAAQGNPLDRSRIATDDRLCRGDEQPQVGERSGERADSERPCRITGRLGRECFADRDPRSLGLLRTCGPFARAAIAARARWNRRCARPMFRRKMPE